MLIQELASLRQKMAERELSESDTVNSGFTFESFFRNHDAIMLLMNGENGQLIDANNAALRFYGYSIDQIKSLNVGDINILPAKELEVERKSALTEERKYFIVSHQLANGSTRIVEVHTTPISQANKTFLFSIIHDITERKRTEDALRESEAKYSSIFKNAVEGFFQSTPEGYFLNVNPAFARIFGYESPEELIATISNISKQYYVYPDDRRRYMEILQEKGIVENFEFNARCKDGAVIWISNSTRAIVDSDGKIICYDGIVKDITTRKQAEEALRESELLFRKLFEDHAAIKFIIDPDNGKIIDANEAAVNYYGWSQERLKQMNIQEINTLPPEDIKKELAKVRTSKRNHFEFRHRRADGSIREVEIFSSKIETKGKDFLHSIIHDISERKRAEEDLIKTVQQLQDTRDMLVQLEKQAAIGRLAAGVAHEILNPASIISSRLQFMEEENLSEQAKENLRVSREQLKRIVKISRDLHQSSANHQAPLICDDFRRVIKEGLKMTEQQIKDNHIRVAYDPPAESIPVKMAMNRLVKVMAHLIINACEAMKVNEGKRLIITVQYHPVSPQSLSMFMIVADNGQGIPTRDLERVFDPFFTTKEPGKGTGLGLSVCRGIVQEHGGNIHAENNDMGGASFIVELPLYYP